MSGKKLFAAFAASATGHGEPPVQIIQRLVDCDTSEQAWAWVREEFRILHAGCTPDAVGVVEVTEAKMRSLLEPLVGWVRSACISPQVGAPFLTRAMTVLGEVAGQKWLSATDHTGSDGPIARLYAGLAMAEAAWRELPDHDPENPYSGHPDGH